MIVLPEKYSQSFSQMLNKMRPLLIGEEWLSYIKWTGFLLKSDYKAEWAQVS